MQSFLPRGYCFLLFLAAKKQKVRRERKSHLPFVKPNNYKYKETLVSFLFENLFIFMFLLHTSPFNQTNHKWMYETICFMYYRYYVSLVLICWTNSWRTHDIIYVILQMLLTFARDDIICTLSHLFLVQVHCWFDINSIWHFMSFWCY